MPLLARLLITIGVLCIAAGAGVYILAKLNIPLGKLPGDILWRRGNTTVYFPVVTSLLLSVLLSLLLWLFNRR